MSRYRIEVNLIVEDEPVRVRAAIEIIDIHTGASRHVVLERDQIRQLLKDVQAAVLEMDQME